MTAMKSDTELEKKLLRQVAQASSDFSLLEPGDKVMVAVSGGKDSMSMLRLLTSIQKRAPFSFELLAVNLDQGQPNFPKETLPNYFTSVGVPFEIIFEDTYSIVKEKVPEGKTYCSLCSRLRRGVLYNVAERLGCTKIALGHHRDDSIETLLLNLLYAGKMQAMPARLESNDGRNTVIRPLIYCAERDLERYAEAQAFPIIPCDLCGSQDNLMRKRVKRLIDELDAENPNVRGNLFAALSNVRLDYLLDPKLSGTLAAAEPGNGAISGPEAPPPEPQPSGRRLPLFSAAPSVTR
jgi:tRNA 2-thiocytidine biosynthesis protein TtcA